MARKNEQTERMRRYTHLIQRETGRAVRPQRFDGFVNLLNKYGTPKDTQEYYQFAREPMIPDERLISFYEGNGLFARIIDAPAEEAVRHGFELDGISDEDIIKFYQEALDELDWEERCMTALKWCRLFGGALAVMLIDDGRGLEEPLDWKNIRSIDDIRIYDRSVIQPDVTSMYKYDPVEPFGMRGSRLGLPEYYHVNSRYGSFVVHDSRVLVFQNGVLPEYTQNSIYQMWGIPEYLRIHRAVRDSEVAHGIAPKMLDKSVQAIYKMKGLSALMSTEDGENQALKRLQTIDMARGLMNSILLDGDGEEYDFKSFSFTGVSDVINTTCNYVSALTNIPQTILFGRSPAGMNSTGDADFENYYNFVQRIQKRVLRKNLRYLLSIIFRAGKASGEIQEVPNINIKFNSLWSMSEVEQVNLELQKVQLEGQRAQVAATYMQMGVIDAKELRIKLAEQDTYDVETMLNDMYDSEEELLKNMPQQQDGGGGAQGAPDGGDNPMGALNAGGGGNPLAAMMGGGGVPQPDEEKAQGDDMQEIGDGSFVTEDEIELATAIAIEDGDVITDFNPKQIDNKKPVVSDEELELAQAIDTESEVDDEDIELGQAIDIEEEETEKETNRKVVEIAHELVHMLKHEQYKKEHPYDSIHKQEEMSPKDQRKWAEHLANENVSEQELEISRAIDIEGSAVVQPSNKEFAQHGGNFVKVESNAEYKTGGESKIDKLESPGIVGTFTKGKETDSLIENTEVSKPEQGDIVQEVSDKPKDSVPFQTSDTFNMNDNAKNLFENAQKARKQKTEEREAEMARKDLYKATELEIAQAIEIQNQMRTDANDPIGKREFDPEARDEMVKMYPEKTEDVKGVGVIVVKDGQLLVGRRNSRNGYGLICGGGGHVEEGELPEDAARRELEEEFGIKAKDLIYIGRGNQNINGREQGNIYLCNEYEGEPECDNVEMVDPVFMDVDELMLKENRQNMFPPFRAGFDLFVSMLKNEFSWGC